MTPVITLLILLFVGAGLAFRGKGKDNNNARGLTPGLVLFGLGLFGLLNYPFDPLPAAIATVAVVLVLPWPITGSVAGMLQGLIAIVIIIGLGLLFRFTPMAEWLGDAIATIGGNSSDLGGIVTDWLPKEPRP